MTGILTPHYRVAPLHRRLLHHQKVVQFCNKNFYIFAQEYKTLAYVSCAATRAPIVKTKMFYNKTPSSTVLDL